LLEPYRSPLPPTVEVPGSALRSVRLRHLRTVIDPSVAAAAPTVAMRSAGILAGYTEWSAHWGTTKAYAGWKWALLRDTLIVLDPLALRSNILITEQGAALAPVRNTMHLLEWIETRPWRRAVTRVIARC
jgi:hypothetical protein